MVISEGDDYAISMIGIGFKQKNLQWVSEKETVCNEVQRDGSNVLGMIESDT